MNHLKFAHGRESGAALIVALIFLLLMTLISTSSMRTSTMQERMAGNLRDWNAGFQGAEAALRTAEEYLLDTDVLPDFNNSGGYYQINGAGRPAWTGGTMSDGNGALALPDAFATAAGLAAPPRYFIEKLSSIRPAGSSTETGTPVEEIYYFRVTAVGFGIAEDDAGNPLTSVVLRSVYRSR